MDKIDVTVKGIILTSLISLCVWLSTVSGDVRINTNNISHGAEQRKEYKVVLKELTIAIQELRVYMAAQQKE